MGIPILSITLASLAVGAAASFVAGSRARWVALATALVFVAETAAMFLGAWGPALAPGQVPVGDAETYRWISLPWLQVNYALGVDGISLVLILLTAFLGLATIVYSWNESHRPGPWFGLILLTLLGSVGVFSALDVLLFFLFWEAVLVPMFFIIGYWGGPRRRYAALKFFIYTHVASVVMLVGLLVLVFYSGSTSLDYSALVARAPALPIVTQSVVFLALLFGFGVKFPVVPFHTWLPDAHVEAPTGGSVLLAGLLLKLGGYGLIRWGILLVPGGFLHLDPIVYVLAFLSIAWGSVVALAQRDMKRLVAYSSINHMGIVLLAIAVHSSLGLLAAVLLMFAHGVVSGLLFMVSGSVHHTFGTRDLASLGGITPGTPFLATMIMIGSLASLGLPALVSFPAEFGALLATYVAVSYWVLIPLLILVVTAAFYLWMMQRLLFGPPRGLPAEGAHDLPFFERAGMAVLVVPIVLFGILPGLLVTVIANSPIRGYP